MNRLIEFLTLIGWLMATMGFMYCVTFGLFWLAKQLQERRKHGK